MRGPRVVLSPIAGEPSVRSPRRGIRVSRSAAMNPTRLTERRTRRAQRASELPKGGEPIVTFTDVLTYLRARFNIEEGQTMAEYGVVLAVITALVVLAIGALSGAIAGALNTVRGYL